MWAKCDMMAVVAHSRLDRFKLPRMPGQTQRKWTTGQISAVDLVEVRKGVLCGLGLSSLTVHL